MNFIYYNPKQLFNTLGNSVTLSVILFDNSLMLAL